MLKSDQENQGKDPAQQNQTSAKLTNSFSDTDDAELTSNPMSAATGDTTTTTQELTPVRPRCNLVRTTLLKRKECDNNN